jgi:signal transduction histidine kinase
MHNDNQESSSTYKDVLIEQMLKQMPVGVALLDAQTLHLLATNAAFHESFIPAWQGACAIGHPVTDWLPLAEENGIVAACRSVAATGVTYRSGEFPFYTREHGVTCWNWTIDPIHDNDGQVVQLLMTASDITPHVQTHQRIEQQKQEFFRIASHELLTPIMIIQGYAEVLKLRTCLGRSLDSAQNREAITAIIAYSEHLARLIGEMLDLAHIQCDQLLVNCAPHDLREILAELIESQSITAKQHRLHFVLQGLQPADTLIACIDKVRILQVISNLINNAVKYSPVDSDIEIGLRYNQEQPTEALIWVKDQGVGIPAMDTPHIFERFYRATNVDRSLHGFGVGLYLAREMVMRHGGCIRAESTEGAGSTFYVTLPLYNCQLDM